jgi:peptidoglycan hydrolase-like protein with peptidoglycan-binding domain
MSRALLSRRTPAERIDNENATARRRTRRAVIAVALIVIAAGGGWAFGYGPLAYHARQDASAGAIPTSTAPVVRGTITVREEDSGTIGYAFSFTVYDGMPGTVTWVPSADAVIRRGMRLFAVNGQVATLFTGHEPAWRAFSPGMSDGPDVRELESNLVTLGYDPYGAITTDDHYDWATQTAVERWQAAQGVPAALQNGQIPLGTIVFLPGRVRVAAVNTGIGATAAPGSVMFTATSTRPVVNVSLPASEESLITVGQHVTITLPDGTGTPGRVLAMQQTSSGSGQQGASGSGGSGSSGGQSASVTIVVRLVHPSVAAGLAHASVQVAIATQTESDVLTAPISALLARPGGGFQVTVVRGRTSRNVTVRTGLFDEIDGTVAISGPGISGGTTVEVPKP